MQHGIRPGISAQRLQRGGALVLLHDLLSLGSYSKTDTTDLRGGLRRGPGAMRISQTGVTLLESVKPGGLTARSCVKQDASGCGPHNPVGRPASSPPCADPSQPSPPSIVLDLLSGTRNPPPVRSGLNIPAAPYRRRLSASRSKQAAQHDKQQLPKLVTTHNSTQLAC